MYSTYNQGKSVVAKRSIRTLETKIFKHMAAISKSAYFDVLDDIVNKYNNTVHRTIKTRPIDVTSILMLNTVKILIKKIPNLKLVIVSEYQNTKIFLLKDIPKTGLQKFLSLAKLKIQFHVISNLNGEKIDGTFNENELQKANKKEFRIEKITKREGNKLYLKWKGQGNLFNNLMTLKKTLYKNESILSYAVQKFWRKY